MSALFNKIGYPSTDPGQDYFKASYVAFSLRRLRDRIG